MDIIKAAVTPNGVVYIDRGEIKPMIETMATLEEKRSALARTVGVGGCCVLRLNEEAIAALAAVPVWGERYRDLEPGYIITMVDEVYCNHTPEEREAILWHELGHIENGHLDRQYATEEIAVINGFPVSTNADQENQADDYAMQNVSPVVLHSALTKIADGVADLMMANHEFLKAQPTWQEIRDEYLQLPPIKERLDRIKQRF